MDKQVRSDGWLCQEWMVFAIRGYNSGPAIVIDSIARCRLDKFAMVNLYRGDLDGRLIINENGFNFDCIGCHFL